MDNLSSREKLKLELKMATLDELNYLLGRYCGPHNLILREKKYGHTLAKDLMRIINEEIAMRMVDDILLSDNQ